MAGYRVRYTLATKLVNELVEAAGWDVQCATADAGVLATDASERRTAKRVGPNKDVAALDLGAEPDVAALVDAVDVDDLVS